MADHFCGSCDAGLPVSCTCPPPPSVTAQLKGGPRDGEDVILPYEETVFLVAKRPEDFGSSERPPQIRGLVTGRYARRLGQSGGLFAAFEWQGWSDRSDCPCATGGDLGAPEPYADLIAHVHPDCPIHSEETPHHA